MLSLAKTKFLRDVDVLVTCYWWGYIVCVVKESDKKFIRKAFGTHLDNLSDESVKSDVCLSFNSFDLYLQDPNGKQNESHCSNEFKIFIISTRLIPDTKFVAVEYYRFAIIPWSLIAGYLAESSCFPSQGFRHPTAPPAHLFQIATRVSGCLPPCPLSPGRLMRFQGWWAGRTHHPLSFKNT